MSLIDFVSNFLALSVMSFQLLLMMPPMNIIFFFASLSLAFAILRQSPFQNPLWKTSCWFVLIQVLLFPAAITVSVLNPNAGFGSIASTALDLLALLSLVLAAFWVYRMKGFRWFAFSAATVLEMILMGAFNVASMSVNCAWL